MKPKIEQKPTASIRIYEETQTDLLTEQSRLKKETGSKPTFADLVDEAWRSYKAAGGDRSSQAAEGLTEDQRDILAMLDEDPSRDWFFSQFQFGVKNASNSTGKTGSRRRKLPSRVLSMSGDPLGPDVVNGR
jgi:hypothetical protein